MGRTAKFVGIGCGGLIVLFIFIGILGAIFGGGSGTETAPESAGQENEQGWVQSEGEIYRGEDPSLYVRSFETRQQFEDFVDQEKADAEAAAEQAQQEAEEAQENAVEEQAQAEQEQQELDEALQEADEAGVAPEPAPEVAPAPEEEAPSVAIIRITGEAGQSFSGSYGNIDTTQSVDGAVPTEYEQEFETGLLSADIISVVMQKNTPGSWELGVEIEVDGEIVQETSTTAEYGVAQVTWDTLQ